MALSPLRIERFERDGKAAYATRTLNRDQGAVAKAAGLWFHGSSCRPGCAGCAAGVPRPAPNWGPAYWYLQATPANAAKLSRVDGLEWAEGADREVLAARDQAEASRSVGTTAAYASIEVVEGARKPFGYQLSGVRQVLARMAAGAKGHMIGDEMGLGKTLQAIVAINSMPGFKSGLICCPASLRLNWALELCASLSSKHHIHVVDSKTEVPPSVLARAHGQTLTSGPVPPPAADIVVTNFDRVRAKKAEDGSKVMGELQTTLMERTWSILVVDEAHKLKNPKAAQTVAVLGKAAKRDPQPGLASRATFTLLLTGTPIPNKPVEMHPLLSVIEPATFGNFFAFAKRYCAAHEGRWGWDFSGSSNLDELQTVLRSTCLTRRLKAEVLTDLPPKLRSLVVLPANGASGVVARERQAYEAWEDEIDVAQADADLAHAAGDDQGYEAAVARLRKAQMAAFEGLSKLRRDVAIAKVPYVADHVRSMLEDGVAKVVVMGHHREVLAKLGEELAEFGTVTVTGETPMADRQGAVDRFQGDAGCRVFLGNILAAGVGLTLTAAHHVVFAELDWVPGNVTQAEDRCHRISQRDVVQVQHLVFDGSLDQRMAEVLVEKQKIADSALDTVHARIVVDAVSDAPMDIRDIRDVRRAPVTLHEDPPEPAIDSLAVGKHLRVVRPATYPVATAAQREAALQGLLQVVAACDGAVEDDGVGFSKVDAYLGRRLIAKGTQGYTDGEVWLALVMCRRYRRQIDPAILVKGGIAKQ